MNLRSLGAIVAAASIAGCGSASAPRTPVETTARPVHFADRSARPDAEDRDPSLRRRSAAAIQARPLLQLLPYRDAEIQISLRGPAPHGHVDLDLSSELTAARARSALARLLRRCGDRSSNYRIHLTTTHD